MFVAAGSLIGLAWTWKLKPPLVLKDGRVLYTLSDAQG
jgi:hypothetical protein